MLNNTSPRQDKSVSHMEYTTSRHRGCLPSSKDNDDQESKKYVLVLTPPRHTSGGLMSSWLVDQQITFDRQRWPLLCPTCPTRWDTPLTVLGPGMGQDSSACRSVNTSCKKALPHREGESRPLSTSRENEGTNCVGICQNLMHKRTTYQSCTDSRRSIADGTVGLNISPTKSTSLAQWFNKYHAGLEVMGSIPMGDFHI